MTIAEFLVRRKYKLRVAIIKDDPSSRKDGTLLLFDSLIPDLGK